MVENFIIRMLLTNAAFMIVAMVMIGGPISALQWFIAVGVITMIADAIYDLVGKLRINVMKQKHKN